MKRKYAVVDLETTGGIPKRDKITEIAVIVFDGEKIIDEFQSLINPERTIPPEITRITGISNDMVEDAPYFYEVAKRVIEIMEGCVFVAHNVRFDYNFLKEEFKSLGFTFTKRNLCTVRLSRKAFPGLKSYSLGNLIRYFNIKVNHRHRAYDDAKATTILLEKIFNEQSTKKAVNDLVVKSIKLTKLPKALNEDSIFQLPESCGVYYFYDGGGEILYIGKSINIQKRVKQHFSKFTSKADKLLQSVHSIDTDITGSELVSLILESYEIKKHLPPVNKIQKTKNYKYAIEERLDKSGYRYFTVVTAAKVENALSYYGSRKTALNHIEQIGEAYQLCHKVNRLEKAQTTCFNYGVEKCAGACIGEELSYSYNERFEDAKLHVNRLFEENFLILEEGRKQDEKAVILVEEGHFKGYGYIAIEDVKYGIEELKEAIKYRPLNPEVDLIIRNYIWTKPQLQIQYF